MTGRRARLELRHRHERRLKIAAFALVALLALGAAAYLLFLKPGPRVSDAPQGSVPVKITMAGFTPSALQAVAGQPLTITLVNPDNAHHSDGGGMHQFAIDELGVNVLVDPETTRTFNLTAPQPGVYPFYCDVCCGGKENPTMQGTLTVTAM